MTRALALSGLILALLVAPALVQAQEGAFPLPAPLYILTSQQELIYIDPINGGQTVLSQPGQPVADFDIAPDGEWYVYRSPDNNAVIVARLDGGSGYVLEFLDAAPPASGPAQTIAWSPDAGRIAYLVSGDVRIAELGAGEYGTALFDTIQGAWVELYWEDATTLIVSDAAGKVTRISGARGQWSLVAASDAPARPQLPVPSYLSAQGVVREGNLVVPGTAGALAFDWGPLPPPLVDAPGSALALPTDLLYVAPDAGGTPQVWRIAQAGGASVTLTAEAAPVLRYDLAPGGEWIAYTTSEALIVARAGGGERRALATLQAGTWPARPAWSPDGTRLAYHDGRGLWVVPVDGSSPPRLIVQNTPFAENVAPVDVRVYFDPRWSADGRLLLAGIGYWEGTGVGIYDAQSGAELLQSGLPASASAWAGDGRVLTWGWFWGYAVPGLFVLDPAQGAQAVPTPLLPEGTPVLDVTADSGGVWYVLVTSTPEMGPQYLRALAAPALNGPYAPLAGGAGGFASAPTLGVNIPGGPVLAAGLRNMTYDENGRPAGALILIDMRTGQTVQVRTFGPVSEVHWLRR